MFYWWFNNFDTYQGDFVVASGVLTADFGSFKVIQDDTRGIAIYLNNAPTYNIGDEITVKGELIDYYGTTEIKPESNDWIGADGTASLPEPKEISISDILDNINNLVRLNSVEVLSVSSSSITVSKEDANATIYCAKAGFDPSTFVQTGDIINIVGIGAIYNEKGQIYPRMESDIIVVSTNDQNTSDTNTADSNTTTMSIENIYSDFDTLNGSDVQIEGIVTANFGSGITVQDDTQGIYLYITSVIPDLSIGNKVTVSGEVTSYKGLVELKVYNSAVTVDGNETVPTPKEIAISELEANMGTLVKLDSLVVESVSSSSITVKNVDGETTSIYCGKAGFDPSEIVSVGDTINAVGISGFYNTPQLYPRSADDIAKQ